MPRRRIPRSHCPISFCLELFGDPWSLLVLRDALMKGKRRFRDFLASEERIASNILTERLKRLADCGLLKKTGAAYAPTKMSLDLLPMLLELSAWGAAHDPHTEAPPGYAKLFASRRERWLREARAAAEDGRPWIPG